jgi:hypothetical protein
MQFFVPVATSTIAYVKVTLFLWTYIIVHKAATHQRPSATPGYIHPEKYVEDSWLRLF